MPRKTEPAPMPTITDAQRDQLRDRLSKLRTQHAGGYLDIYEALRTCGRDYSEKIERDLISAVELKAKDGELANTFIQLLIKYGLPWPAENTKSGKAMLKLWLASAVTWTFPPDPEVAKF